MIRRRFAWAEAETAHRMGAVNYYIGAKIVHEQHGTQAKRKLYPFSGLDLIEKDREVPKDVVGVIFNSLHLLVQSSE